MSWYRAPLWDLRPDITSCQNVVVWNCGLISEGRPLWREDGSAICSVITQWVEERRTLTILYCLIWDSPQPGRPGSHIYILQEQGGPVIPPGTEFPLRRLLQLAGLRWRYFNPPLPGGAGPRVYSLQEQDRPVQNQSQMSKSKPRHDGRSVNQYVLLPSPLGVKEVPSERISIRHQEVYIKANVLCYHWEGCMWSMQCNVEFGYQLSIYSGLIAAREFGNIYTVEAVSYFLTMWDGASSLFRRFKYLPVLLPGNKAL
jgi:hypothetical protein